MSEFGIHLYGIYIRLTLGDHLMGRPDTLDDIAKEMSNDAKRIFPNAPVHVVTSTLVDCKSRFPKVPVKARPIPPQWCFIAHLEGSVVPPTEGDMAWLTVVWFADSPKWDGTWPEVDWAKLSEGGWF